MNKTKFACAFALVLSIINAPVAFAEDEPLAPGLEKSELLDLPLEDLLSLESTSVAKKRQKINESSAAVYVISQDDIRRSSATSIPDLLRTVPGLEVGEQQNGRTVVAVRGFKSIFTNSLLVMVDGRSLYVTTLSGVFWDQLLIPMNDIERIEIVRGPGATLWGANAVNGVINIITKHSGDALGVHSDVRVSAKEQEASLAFGDRINDALSYRVSANIRYDNGPTDALGKNLSKRWQGQGLMGRLDWEPTDRDAYTLQSEYSEGKFDFPFGFVRQDVFNPGYEVVQTENNFKSFNVLGRWVHRSNDNFDWSLQAYYDIIKRTEIGTVPLVRKQADLDFGMRWRINSTHEINAGIAGRLVDDKAESTRSISLGPMKNKDRWISGYIQDDISLFADRLRLTLGTKIEESNFIGFEFQPSAKLFYRPSDSVALWAGVSRAIRTPSRFERDADINLLVDLPGSPLNPLPLPIYTRISGQPDAKPERLTAYEAGLRAQLDASWSINIAGYFNTYEDLSTIDPVAVTPIFVTPIPFPVGLQADAEFMNNGRAETWGGEVLIKGNVTPWWKTELAYSHFNYRLNRDPMTGVSPNLLFPLSGSPRNSASITNDMDFGEQISLRSQLRYVGELYGGLVPDYFSLDGRLSYQIANNVELSIIGENLLKKRRLEFVQPTYQTPFAYVPRSVALQARVRF
ncbi:MAG: TonB-dependent receptor plug domain-containing protein [Sphingorhabdus sp.]